MHNQWQHRLSRSLAQVQLQQVRTLPLLLVASSLDALHIDNPHSSTLVALDVRSRAAVA